MIAVNKDDSSVNKDDSCKQEIVVKKEFVLLFDWLKQSWDI